MKVSPKSKSKPQSKADKQRELREQNAKAAEQQQPPAEEPEEGNVQGEDNPGTQLATTEKGGKVDILPVLSEEEKKVKAQEEDKRFRELEQIGRKTFAEMSFILRDFKAYELWRYVQRRDKTGQPTGKEGFRGFDAWLSDASPLGRSSGYAALRAIEKLLPLIPKKELETMPRYSIELLAKVPKMKLENPTIRKRLTEAAQSETREELTETIQQEVPEAHIEQKKNIRLDVSAADNAIGDAFQFAKDVFECETDAEAIEVICVDFMDSPCNLEQYAGMTNREAWEQWKKAQNAEKAGKVFTDAQTKPSGKHDAA